MRSLAIATVLCALAASVNGAPHGKTKKCHKKHRPTATGAPSLGPSPSADTNNWIHFPQSSAPVVPTDTTTGAPGNATDVPASSGPAATDTPSATTSGTETSIVPPPTSAPVSDAPTSDAPTPTVTPTDAPASSAPPSETPTDAPASSAPPSETPTDAPASSAPPSETPSLTPTSSVAPAPTGGVPTGDPAYLTASDPLAVAVLAKINSYRSEYGISQLTWNEDAAGKAWDQVQACSWTVTYRPNEGKYSDVQAMNPTDLTKAVDALMGVNYNYATPGLEGDNAYANGYTNILWKPTTSVGCAWNRCPDMDAEAGPDLLTCMFDTHDTYDPYLRSDHLDEDRERVQALFRENVAAKA